MTRKIISVAVASVPNTQHTQCDYFTIVLCDDGTLWEQSNRSNTWVKYTSIPQSPTESTTDGSWKDVKR